MASKKKSIAEVEERNIGICKELAKLVEDRRANEITLLDMRRVCNFTDTFLIATATSTPQMKGIARDVEKFMHSHKVRQLARSGVEDGKWVVMDYGDIVIHIFDHESRQFYQLEEMWGDAASFDW